MIEWKRGADGADAPPRAECYVFVGVDGMRMPNPAVSERCMREQCSEMLQDTTNVPEAANGSDSELANKETGVGATADAKGEKEPLRRRPLVSRLLGWYWRRLTGCNQSLSVYGIYPSWDQLIAFTFTCLTLILLGLVEHYGIYPLLNHTLSVFFPAIGASCTLVYAAPKSPMAQPRNIIVSHVTAAIIGTALANAFRTVKEQPFGQHCAGALGVALHLVLMMLTNTMHPPASATVITAATAKINAYYHDEGFLFVICPVLFGAVFTTVCAWLLNNLVPSRSPYPQYW
ncbi:hypothetical protein LSCM1_02068 [Leishmania martiniquensis]|uniref:HPP transmembrane region domain-containing protein n=1 Tax=Leishmania martiniquensis TaxID=1580590 RepID=A0A836G9Q4_9TRYP|nr:hypothetical protein LSCM1_02068 [Leishmania martiniquensis]